MAFRSDHVSLKCAAACSLDCAHGSPLHFCKCLGLPRLRSLLLLVAVVSLFLCQASPPDIYQLNSISSLPSGLLSSLISSSCYCLLLMRPISAVSHFSCVCLSLNRYHCSPFFSSRCFHLPIPFVNTLYVLFITVIISFACVFFLDFSYSWPC